jgi:surface antigen
MNPIGIGCLLIALAMIPACTQIQIEAKEETRNAALPAPAPLFVFLAAAAAGETGVVEDPRTGETVTVTAARAYHAASGRFCRLFRTTPPGSYEGLTEGLACRDDAGHWTMSALLINPEDLETPRLRHP